MTDAGEEEFSCVNSHPPCTAEVLNKSKTLMWSQRLRMWRGRQKDRPLPYVGCGAAA
jgi:hypothetical protein